MKIKVVSIVGPTASSKTELSIHIAKRFSGEIVSADSMQVYKNLNIGSAKPSPAQLSEVAHHMISIISPEKYFNVQDYVTLASRIIADINSRKKLPIIVGGTGLYIDSLLQNVRFSDAGANFKLREELFGKDKETLYAELVCIDPEYAAKLHPNNVKRVVRALEIYRLTGDTPGQQAEKSKQTESPYDVLYLGLNFSDRQRLYRRIDRRVDNMLETGLVQEAKQVLSENMPTASQAIGYKELKPYFAGEIDLCCAADSIKQNTRRYAKRQLTWFGRNKNINWLHLDDFDDFCALKKAAVKLVEDRNFYLTGEESSPI